VALPLVARAQAERGRRVGVLSAPSENAPEMRSWVAEFVHELARLGWVDGRNLQIDQRWGNDDLDRIRMFAKELIELKPDAVLAIATTATAALHEKPAISQLYLRWSPIQSARASSLACRGRAPKPTRHHTMISR
jgi:putative tryptophan/tyrosine transport system substrate-binding protein